MTVAVYETNLMWSQRFKLSLTKLGHECMILGPKDAGAGSEADVAIVNLGDPSYDLRTLVPTLQAAGTFVIGHAGHKEKDLHALGRDIGCDRLATNSEITHKLESLLNLAK